MKVIIDYDVVEKNGLTKAQFFFLLAAQYGIVAEDITTLHTSLGLISKNHSGNYFAAPPGTRLLTEIINNSDKGKARKGTLELVIKMQNLFPSGKKAGTNNYWRGNAPELTERLNRFFTKFGNYSDEEVLAATKKYVDSYYNDTRLMKTLKYFISKKRDDGNIEYDLLTFIENLESVDDDDSILETTQLL